MDGLFCEKRFQIKDLPLDKFLLRRISVHCRKEHRQNAEINRGNQPLPAQLK